MTPSKVPKAERKQARKVFRRTLAQQVLLPPNLVTFGRIALIPFIGWLMASGEPRASFWAMILFGFAAASDGIDGWMARRWNMQSPLGRLLDPMADKLLVMVALVFSTALGRIPAWFVALLLSRELAINGLRTMASTEGLEVHVAEAGKWKTAFQLCGMLALITHFPYRIDFGFTVQVVDFNAVGFWLLALAMVFSLGSAFLYFKRFFDAIIARERAP